LQCNDHAHNAEHHPVVDTVLPAQTSCVFSGTIATCTVTSNVFLVTGSTRILNPLTPSGATVIGCTSTNPFVIATGPGGTLPTVTNFILDFLPGGGMPVTFQAQLDDSTQVPANTCAFTSIGTPSNPAGIGGDTIFGTVTLSLPPRARCGPELTQRGADYIPNASGVLNPFIFQTYFPQTAAGTISGGFLCGSGDPTILSQFTSTGLPVELSCSSQRERKREREGEGEGEGEGGRQRGREREACTGEADGVHGQGG